MSTTTTLPVLIRTHAAPGARVELLGDLTSWRFGPTLLEEEPGHFALFLEAPPGIHRVKLRIDGVWCLVPGLPSEYAEGVENSLLVVGGLAGPVFAASDRRTLCFFHDGRLLLAVEQVRASAGNAVAVVRSPGHADVVMPLHETLRRAGRTFLRGEVQLPSDAIPRVIFPDVPHQALLPPRRTASGAPPAWLPGAVLYGIFVDRFWRGAASPPDHRASVPSTPSTPHVFYGGDLDGVLAALPHLESLGVDALVLTPIHQSDTPHRYDGVDLLAIDERLGGEAGLTRLIAGAHRRGIKVIVDASLTHVSEKHPRFLDVLTNQEQSSSVSWFRIKRFPVVRKDPSTYDAWYTCPELPMLQLASGSPARAHVIEAALALVRRGVDGLRLDAMDDAPDDFWRELRQRLRAENPELLLLGEIVGDRLASRAEEAGVDVATDFRIREALLDYFARDRIDGAELWSRLLLARHRTGAFDECFRCGFLDNHDTARFLTVCAAAHPGSSPTDHAERMRTALALLLFLPSTAWLSWGTEGLLAAGGGEARFDEAWPERLPMPPASAFDRAMVDLLRDAIHLRRELIGAPSLLHGGAGLVLERPTVSGGWVRLRIDSPVSASWERG